MNYYPWSVPASVITGLTPGAIVYGSPTGTVAQLADVAVGQVLTSGGVGAAPAWSADPTLTTLAMSGRLSGRWMQPATPAGVNATGTDLDLYAGQGGPGNGATRGGLGADLHLRAGAGGTNGGGGLGFGGSTSWDCGAGAANGAEPHLQIGITNAVTIQMGRVGATLTILGTQSNLSTSGNNQITSTGGTLDFVANGWRIFTAAITQACTVTPSSGGLAITNNVMLGGATTPGTSAVGCLILGNGATAPTTSTDKVHLWSKDISAGNATLAVFTETAPVTEVVVADTTIQIFWNGAKYKLLATLVP